MEYKEATAEARLCNRSGAESRAIEAAAARGVYLAPDFKPSSDKLRASLEHHFDVLPENPTGLLGLPPGTSWRD